MFQLVINCSATRVATILINIQTGEAHYRHMLQLVCNSVCQGHQPDVDIARRYEGYYRHTFQLVLIAVWQRRQPDWEQHPHEMKVTLDTCFILTAYLINKNITYF